MINRARAERTLKREKEVNFWKSQLEAKTSQLQAILSEQRNILAWGPNSSEVCFFCCYTVKGFLFRLSLEWKIHAFPSSFESQKLKK